MPSSVTTPKITIPTGYEAEQRAIERKRRIAEALLGQGMDAGGINSWTQVLGKLAQTYVGNRKDKSATKDEGALGERISKDYAGRVAAFNTDAKSMDPMAMVDKYGADPMLKDNLDPHRDAVAKRLAERESLRMFNGQLQRSGDVMGKTAFDPNAAVNFTPDGRGIAINPLKVTASLAQQGYDMNGQGPYGIKNAQTSMALPAAQAAQPAQAAMGLSEKDWGLFSQEEQQVMMRELARRRGLSPEASAYIPDAKAGVPPPSAVVDGKPAWQINGKWYDNPEGK